MPVDLVSQCRVQGWGMGKGAHCLHVEWLLLLLLVCRTVSSARSAQHAARQHGQHTKTRIYVIRPLFPCLSRRRLGPTGLGWTTATVGRRSVLLMGQAPRRPSSQQREDIWTFCLGFLVADTQRQVFTVVHQLHFGHFGLLLSSPSSCPSTLSCVLGLARLDNPYPRPSSASTSQSASLVNDVWYPAGMPPYSTAAAAASTLMLKRVRASGPAVRLAPQPLNTGQAPFQSVDHIAEKIPTEAETETACLLSCLPACLHTWLQKKHST